MTQNGGRRGRTHRIVIAGAGHAAMLALTRLGTPPPGAEITLVSRGDAAHYSGMVPGWIEGIYPLEAMKVPLAPFLAIAMGLLSAFALTSPRGRAGHWGGSVW